MVVVIAVMLVAGFLHGLRDAYHADPHVFHFLNPARHGFFGSEAWLASYRNLEVSKGLKPLQSLIGGLDFWHVNHWISLALTSGLIGWLAGSWKIGVVAFVVHVVAAIISYRIRKIKGKEKIISNVNIEE